MFTIGTKLHVLQSLWDFKEAYGGLHCKPGKVVDRALFVWASLYARSLRGEMEDVEKACFVREYEIHQQYRHNGVHILCKSEEYWSIPRILHYPAMYDLQRVSVNAGIRSRSSRYNLSSSFWQCPRTGSYANCTCWCQAQGLHQGDWIYWQIVQRPRWAGSNLFGVMIDCVK